MEEKSQRMARLGQLQETQRRREAAVVPRMLARRVRYGLQLQLKRKEQINRMLRRGLISTRRQLHLQKIQLRKYKLLSEKMKKEMEEQLENKNETIVDLHIQVQWLKKDVEQFAVKERTLQSEKEELANEITTINTLLQNQLLENTVLANQTTELQQQLELKDQAISNLLIYSQNLRDNFTTSQEKLNLLDQEMDEMVHERNLILHYVVTMQACLYDDVEQWLHQLLEDSRITEHSVLKFKTMQEQINLMKPILARDRAGLQEEGGEEVEEEGEEEEEEDEDEEDEEEEGDDEKEGEEEEEEEGENWETTESEEVEEERSQKEGKVEEEINKVTEGKEVEEGEKQREEEEEKKVQEKKERTTDDEDFYKFRHQTDRSTSTDARHKNVFEDTSESESRCADSSSSGLSSGSTSSTARNTSDLDSNGSTSTGSAENRKVTKKNKLKSWFKKIFMLKTTRKPAASESDRQDNEKASDPSVWKIILSAICL